MPQTIFHLPPFQGEVTPASLNRFVATLNQHLMAITSQLGEMQGRNGTPTFHAHVDLNGNRITNLAPSRDDSDPVTRGELVAYGLFQRRIGDPHVASVTGTMKADQGLETGSPTQPRHATDLGTSKG
jgi:hypothetical protein